MSDKNYKWTFPFLPENGSDVGFNEPMSENFKKFPCTSLVRESIQNSLDVQIDKNQPVHVAFTIRKLDNANYSQFFKLREHIASCLDYYQNFDKAHLVYQPMLEYLDQIINKNEKMYYIKVSDYNTTGMTYIPQNNENAFYAFVRAAGVNLKQDAAAGGSFGFGKAAYFNFSKIRTLLVSTVNTEGQCFFEGVSSLCTHRIQGKKVSHIGYYDSENGFPVQNVDNIPERFKHKGNNKLISGTDFNIMGIDIVTEDERKNDGKQGDTQEEIYHEMQMAVLRNFWLAIYENRLRVTIGDLDISRDNLSQIMENAFPFYEDNKHTSNYNPRGYFEAVRDVDTDQDHKVYIWNLNEKHSNNELYSSKESQQLGTIKCYLYKHKQASNKVLYMREPRMLIERNSNNTANNFFCVFVCENGLANEILRSMENPAHNEWNSKNSEVTNKNKKKAMNALLDEFRNFVTDSIKDFFHINERNFIEMAHLDEYLYIPSEVDEEQRENESIDSDITGDLQDQGTSMTTVLTDISSLKIGKSSLGHIIIQKRERATEDEDGPLKSGKSNNPRENPGHGMGINTDKSNKPDKHGTDGIYLKPIPHVFRSYVQQTNGRYHHILVIHTKQKYDKCQIQITVGTDTKDEIISILKTSNGISKENKLLGVKLEKGRNIIDIVFSDNLQHSINLSLHEHA